MKPGKIMIDASTQELTKSTSVEGLEESYVHRFSHMPKVFSLSLTFQISSSMRSNILHYSQIILHQFQIRGCAQIT